MTPSITTYITIAFVGLLNNNYCYSFSPNSIQNLPGVVVGGGGRFSSTSPSSSSELRSHAIDSEDDAMQLMMRASTCAHSDGCSIDDAETYLNDVIHIQSDCISGSLKSQQICNDVLFSSEVIAALRNKISEGRSVSSMNSTPFLLSAAVIYTMAGIMGTLQHPVVEPFTTQEWMYAIRDGYYGEMLLQYMKHGGFQLINDNNNYTILPFTLQEWWWAIRDGYLPEMIDQSMKNGGLLSGYMTTSTAATTTTGMTLSSSCVDDTSIPMYTPFLLEEYKMALKDGYLNQMISHYIKHGGL